MVDPEVAVIEIEYVPFGVVGPPPQAVSPPNAITDSNPRQLRLRSNLRSLRFRVPNSGNKMSANVVPAAKAALWKRAFPDKGSLGWPARAVVVGFVSVSIVRVDVALPETLGVTLAGENLHTVFLGNEPHARFVAELKPLTEVTVMVTVAGLPALKEPLVGVSAIEKSAGPGQIVTATLLETEAALLVSPP